MAAPVVALSHPSVGFIIAAPLVIKCKILTANHVLSMQQINPSHHLISAVYVYPKRLAGSFEGHWLSALHRFASVFPRPSILRLDLTFLLLSFFFFPFIFLFGKPLDPPSFQRPVGPRKSLRERYLRVVNAP
jgi:hypothetical protein